jgi:hypothetical protein
MSLLCFAKFHEIFVLKISHQFIQRVYLQKNQSYNSDTFHTLAVAYTYTSALC